MDEGERKLFVGNLFHTVHVNQLRNEFNKFGKIQSLYISPGFPITYAFILFKNKEDAKNAVNQMNGKVLNNRKLRINLSSDHDKEFLANISAESCSEDETNLNKENGKKINKKEICNNKNNRVQNKSNTIPVKYKSSEISSLKNDPITARTTDQLSKQFSESNEDLNNNSSSSEESNIKGKPLNRYFNQSINPKLSSFVKPKEIKKQSNDFDKFNLVNFKKKLNKKKKQLNIDLINLNQPSTSSTNSKLQNDQFSAFQFKKPNNDLFIIYRQPNKNKNFDKQFIRHTKSVQLGNNTNFVNPFTKVSCEAIQKKNSNNSKKEDSIDKNPFKFNKKAFGFTADEFPDEKISTESLSTDSSLDFIEDKPDADESVEIIFNGALTKKYGNTTLFDDHDIDERLKKSIEIITLD